MNNPVSKLMLALLFFNTTGYTIAKELTPSSPFINKSQLKGSGFLMILLIEFSLFSLVFERILKTNFHVVTILTVSAMAIHILLDIIYQKKIESIVDNYFSYYNIVFPVLFGLFSIGGVVYLFMFG